MQHLHVKMRLFKAGLFLFIALTAFMSSAKAGLDYYRIFLGKKLIYERYVNKPLDLQSLPFSAADANEMLTVYYFQCNAPNKTGSNRSITLKDDNGNTIKQWSFADAQGTNTAMTIPVKELLQLQKENKNRALSLYYGAEGRNGGEKLAAIQPALKDVTYIHPAEETTTQMAWQIINLILKNIVVV
jgi:hypothetical protein